MVYTLMEWWCWVTTKHADKFIPRKGSKFGCCNGCGKMFYDLA